MPALHDIAWRNVGPAVSGGRTSGVAGTDQDPYLYYFGGADGGVWKSSNGGLTWRNTWPRDAVGAIGAIAIDPHDRNTVWVGTGEPNFRNDISYGDGLWLTHDGGAHWRNVGLRETWAIAQIVVDPAEPPARAGSGGGQPLSRQHRCAASIARPTADERGSARFTSAHRAAPRTSRSTRAIPTWRTPESGSSGAFHGASPAAARSTGFLNLPTAARRGANSEAAVCPAGTMGRIGIAVAGRRVYALIQSKEGVLWRSDDGGTTGD